LLDAGCFRAAKRVNPPICQIIKSFAAAACNIEGEISAHVGTCVGQCALLTCDRNLESNLVSAVTRCAGTYKNVVIRMR